MLEQKQVLWIDTASCVPLSRLLAGLPSSFSRNPEALDSYVKHLQISSLAKLLILFMRPPAYLKDFDVIIIDDITTLLSSGFAYFVAKPSTKSVSAADRTQRAEDHTTKRSRAATELVNALSRLAAQYDVAVLLLGKMVSRIFAGQRARLVSVLGEEGDATSPVTTSIWTRLYLFRNDVLFDNPASHIHSKPSLQRRQTAKRGVPHACAIKCAGVNYENASLSVFRIVNTGIADTDEWFDEFIVREPSNETVIHESREASHQFTEIFGSFNDSERSDSFVSAKQQLSEGSQDEIGDVTQHSPDQIASEAETIIPTNYTNKTEISDSEEEDIGDWSDIDISELLS